MTDLAPTEEQIDIIRALDDSPSNILINALAGTGKTTILEMIVEEADESPIMYLAFSKRDKEVAEKRLPSTTTVRTFNGLGHRIWSKTVGKIVLDDKKTQRLLKEELNELKGADKAQANSEYWEILGAVGKAKALGYIPDGKFPHAKRLCDRAGLYISLDEDPSEVAGEIIDSILCRSISEAYKGIIDFNDQIYMPALFGGTFPRFPLVCIDEAQDLNPTNHALLHKLCRDRIIAVGDPWQSIYGFRGAKSEGMQALKEKYSMIEKTISISFRCPEVIADVARQIVPQFRNSKPGGTYAVLDRLDYSNIPDDSTIICRNNAPLYKTAFKLLSNKRSVTIAGSDVGPRLIRIMQKLGPDDISREDLQIKIHEWADAKIKASNAPKTVTDMRECMLVFASFGETLGQAVGYAKYLFEQQGAIKLTTGHKSKGGEWDRVFHLNPWMIGEGQQETNLRYVITTRSKQELYEIDYANITW